VEQGLPAVVSDSRSQRLLTVFQMAVSLVRWSAAIISEKLLPVITLTRASDRTNPCRLGELFQQPPGRHESQAGVIGKNPFDPQVEAAAITSQVPLYGQVGRWAWRYGFPGDSRRFVQSNLGDSRLFQDDGDSGAIGPIFNEQDRANSPKVMLVNETFVHRFLGSGSPIGATVRTEPSRLSKQTYEVIGWSKTPNTESAPGIPPIAFAPASQHPFSALRIDGGALLGALAWDHRQASKGAWLS